MFLVPLPEVLDGQFRPVERPVGEGVQGAHGAGVDGQVAPGHLGRCGPGEGQHGDLWPRLLDHPPDVVGHPPSLAAPGDARDDPHGLATIRPVEPGGSSSPVLLFAADPLS